MPPNSLGVYTASRNKNFLGFLVPMARRMEASEESVSLTLLLDCRFSNPAVATAGDFRLPTNPAKTIQCQAEERHVVRGCTWYIRASTPAHHRPVGCMLPSTATCPTNLTTHPKNIRDDLGSRPKGRRQELRPHGSGPRKATRPPNSKMPEPGDPTQGGFWTAKMPRGSG
jgi:hypothetical protein